MTDRRERRDRTSRRYAREKRREKRYKIEAREKNEKTDYGKRLAEPMGVVVSEQNAQKEELPCSTLLEIRGLAGVLGYLSQSSFWIVLDAFD